MVFIICVEPWQNESLLGKNGIAVCMNDLIYTKQQNITTVLLASSNGSQESFICFEPWQNETLHGKNDIAVCMND